MECDNFAKIAGELAHDGLMESSVRNSALDHARACPECGLRLASERGLSRALAFAAEAEVESAPPSVKAALMRAFAERRAVATASGQMLDAIGTRAVRMRRFLQAAAAVLLILLAAVPFYMMRSRTRELRNSEEPSPPVAAGNPPNPVESPGMPPPGRSLPEVEQLVNHSRGLKSLKPRLASSRTINEGKSIADSTADLEAITDFIPLTYLTKSTAIESGQVMRVKVPVSTFIALGVPINNQHADELVNAELVMGDDGVMRAVRLLK